MFSFCDVHFKGKMNEQAMSNHLLNARAAGGREGELPAPFKGEATEAKWTLPPHGFSLRWD